MSPARFAIALVTFNSREHLAAYFHQTAAVAKAGGFPLVVVDNGSKDGSVEIVRERAADHRMTVIENRSNRGYAAAVNQAFATVPGRDVFLINPDVDVSGDELLTLAAILRQRPRAGIVAPRLINPDGSAQTSARPFPSLLAMAGHASAARRLPAARRASDRYLSVPTGSEPTRVDWAIGAALLIRRTAYDQVGGWDEHYFLYLEDTDFCLRCARVGWETVYVPAVTLRHHHDRASEPSRGSVYSSSARRAHVISMVRFFARYPRLLAERARG